MSGFWDNHGSELWSAMRFFFLMAFFFCCAGVFALVERLQERRAARAREGSMLNDTDDGSGDAGRAPTHRISSVELGEMEPASDVHSPLPANDEPQLEGIERVRWELKRLKLEKYADAFEENGFDLWPEIVRLDQDRFRTLVRTAKLPANHAARLNEQLALQRSRLGIRRPGDRAIDEDADVDEACVIL